MPSARICLALVEIAIVADAGTLFALCDMDKIAKPPCYFILYEFTEFNLTLVNRNVAQDSILVFADEAHFRPT
jgi:hypothetical protein